MGQTTKRRRREAPQKWNAATCRLPPPPLPTTGTSPSPRRRAFKPGTTWAYRVRTMCHYVSREHTLDSGPSKNNTSNDRVHSLHRSSYLLGQRLLRNVAMSSLAQAGLACKILKQPHTYLDPCMHPACTLKCQAGVRRIGPRLIRGAFKLRSGEKIACKPSPAVSTSSLSFPLLIWPA